MYDLTQLLDIRCRCPESPCPPALLLFSLWEASGFSISCSSILSTLWPSFQVTVLPGVQSVFGISPCFEWEEGVSAAFIVLCFRCHWALWQGLMIIWLMRMMVCPLVMFVCETLVTADCVLTSSAVCQPVLPECDCLRPWSTHLPGNILIDCTTQICNIDAEICERVRGNQS